MWGSDSRNMAPGAPCPGVDALDDLSLLQGICRTQISDVPIDDRERGGSGLVGPPQRAERLKEPSINPYKTFSGLRARLVRFGMLDRGGHFIQFRRKRPFERPARSFPRCLARWRAR